jgi:uncharacterized protein (DUF4415 family)
VAQFGEENKMSTTLASRDVVLVDTGDGIDGSDERSVESVLIPLRKSVKRGRPVQSVTKIAVKLRLDPDIVAAFKGSGRGWQTRINHALRDWLLSNPSRLHDRIEDLEDALTVRERAGGAFVEVSLDDL